MTSDCIYRDTLLKDIEENVVFSGQTPNAEIVGANKVISRIKAAPVADTDLQYEHQIFELVRLYKAIDWETKTVLFYGW